MTLTHAKLWAGCMCKLWAAQVAPCTACISQTALGSLTMARLSAEPPEKCQPSNAHQVMSRDCTRRPIKENSTRRRHMEASEQLRIDQGQEDHLLECIDIMVQATNLPKGHSWVNLRRP